jgi:hypothetical protein
LKWQDPRILFSLGGPETGDHWLGIAYDPLNNSLWISGFPPTSPVDYELADYSLSGTLLSSFTTGLGLMAALGFDPADGTLWFSYNESNMLYQYSTSGTLLQTGTPSGLPSGFNSFLAGDFAEGPQEAPEPSSLALLGVACAALGALTLRKRHGALRRSAL